MGNVNSKSFTNVFLLEGDSKKGKEYLADILQKNAQVDLNRESADINIFDCNELDTKKLKEILANVIVMPRGELKVYIFLNGEELSVIMQNAMLKTFEEPPTYAFFAILCRNAGNILPTLRSRCNYVYTGGIQQDVEELSSESLAIIQYVYEGSLGTWFQELKRLNKRDTALNFIYDYLKYLDKVGESSDNKISETRFEIAIFLEKARKLIEGNANCSASLEAMGLNIMEVLSDYSSRNKI